MTSQLERDIDTRINERLRQWAKDSVELCKMAEISHAKAMALLGGGLMTALVILFVETDSDPDDVGDMMRDTLRQAKKIKREREEAGS